jgi:hypothetical protein
MEVPIKEWGFVKTQGQNHGKLSKKVNDGLNLKTI